MVASNSEHACVGGDIVYSLFIVVELLAYIVLAPRTDGRWTDPAIDWQALLVSADQIRSDQIIG